MATLLGCEPGARPAVLEGMLHRSPREITGYWLQLVVSTGIATLGLVLGSTAVVIGAMLVAPLMGPILGLGMGLAVGSPFLVVRGTGRVLASVAVVIAASAGITRLLPFHEVNAEIAARVTPTALDLATAVFCAIAGVYSAMRPASDVATTAAGTSIGISLVPPLCVSGFGVGTANWSVATGALLLFVTNFVAIALVGTLSFTAAGFGQVDVAKLESESEVIAGAGAWSRIARGLANLFRSRGGPWLRIVMPLALLGAVYSPLRTGLDEVAWQVAARGEVEAAIAELPGRVVESQIRVERRRVEVVIFLLGAQSDAVAARATLTERITRATQTSPRVDVFAVPDATEFEALERSLEKPKVIAPAPLEVPSLPEEGVREGLSRIDSALRARWPTGVVGEPLRTDVSVVGGKLVLHVIHLGPELGPAASLTLEQALVDEIGANLHIDAAAIPPGPVDLANVGALDLARVIRAMDLARQVEPVHVCVSLPPLGPTKAAKKPSPEPIGAREALIASAETHPRVTFAEGKTIEVRFVLGACPSASP